MSVIDYSARLTALKQWLCSQYQLTSIKLDVVSGDASFRRYFRFNLNGVNHIAVDAPPAFEDSHPFVAVARQLLAQGVNVPQILRLDLEAGFMVLTDLGDTLLSTALNEQTCDALYQQAMQSLLHIQQADNQVPPYDEALLMREMQLFTDWYLTRHLQHALTFEQQQQLDETYHWLKNMALAQPQVFVHRDYHSRNLMLVPDGALGVIDFQDAVWGPITYDLVSLLRDCYVKWPLQQVQQWVQWYFHQLQQQGVLSSEVDSATFMRWFDLMGIQRHLKAAGIFARLNYRDGKSGYLNDIPRTVGYIIEVAEQYPELSGFAALLHELVVPHLPESQVA